jgi:hypothetical protein
MAWIDAMDAPREAVNMKFKPAKTPELKSFVDISSVDDLLNRASQAISRAQKLIKIKRYAAAAEASGQAMMLARHAEIILLCSLAAERARLIAVNEVEKDTR